MGTERYGRIPGFWDGRVAYFAYFGKERTTEDFDWLVIENTVKAKVDERSDSDESSNAEHYEDNEVSNKKNNNWDPQHPTLASNARSQSRHSSTQSSQASYHQGDVDFGTTTANAKSVSDDRQMGNEIEYMIDDIKDGINKVAHQLSQGMSFEEDKTKGDSSDSQSEKSLSSLESDMAAKLAQPDLVPPDDISNRPPNQPTVTTVSSSEGSAQKLKEWQKSSYYKQSLERQGTLRRASSEEQPEDGNSSPTKIQRRN